LLIGGFFEVVSGYCLGIILRRHMLPEYLHNLITLTILFTTFTMSNHFAHESGLLAVSLMGIWLANMRDVNIAGILDFKENLTILFISGLFIVLAARLDLAQLQILGLTMLLLFVIIQWVARPFSVWLHSLASGLIMVRKNIIKLDGTERYRCGGGSGTICLAFRANIRR
jgi:NhaP-type Na+/H+ or K+/H+ antiporter